MISISELPKASTARLIKNVGATRVSHDAVNMLAEAMETYGTNVARRANDFAHHAGRKTIKAEDIKLAMQ